MSAYIPPYPFRSKKSLSIFQLIKSAKKNLLSVWDEDCFEKDFMTIKILKQKIVVVNSPEIVKWAFLDNHEIFESKSNLMKRALKPIVGDGLFISDGSVWEERRRPIGSAIHTSKLPYYFSSMQETIVDLKNKWLTEKKSNIDMLSEMTKLTADVIARAIFGNQISDDALTEIADGFSDYQKKIGVLGVLPLLGMPDSITYFFTRGVRRSAKRVQAVIDKLVEKCLKNSGNSFLRFLNTEAGAAIDANGLRNEAAVIFMAGHETTANTLSWVWYILSQDAESRRRLYDEIDTVLEGRVPTLADVSKLHFTRAMVEETLRLYPPIPILSRQAGEDTQWNEKHIKKGSIMIVVPWLLHRHRKYWSEPDSFIPDRFLSEAKKPIRYSYIPFSVGPRVCAGMTFGLTEAILVVAILAQTFDFSLKENATIAATSHLSLRPNDSDGRLPMKVEIRNANKSFSKDKNVRVSECPYLSGRLSAVEV